MGIYDREYYRRDQPGGMRAARPRIISMTAWLIIINVAVFGLDKMVLGNARVTVDWGQGYYEGATPQQRARGEVDRSRTLQGTDGLPYHPIVDRQSIATTREGLPIVDGTTGRPLPLEVGAVRFRSIPPIEAYGHFSTAKGFFGLQVWRFITFQFLHANITHLLFNMIGLFFLGGLVEAYLGPRRYLAFYLLTGLCGAGAYLLLNVLGYVAAAMGMAPIPFLLFHDIYTPLVGASAGVFGVLMAGAFIAPGATLLIMGIIPMRMKTAVYLFVALAVINLLTQGRNAGGDAAHLGGAIAGAYFIRRPHLLREFFSIVGVRKKSPGSAGAGGGGASTKKIDRILDKVRERGLDSLTARERRLLKDAGKEIG